MRLGVCQVHSKKLLTTTTFFEKVYIIIVTAQFFFEPLPHPLPFLELVLIVKANRMGSLITSFLCVSLQWHNATLSRRS